MMKLLRHVLFVLLFVSCGTQSQTEYVDVYGSSLFRDVQLAAVFPDSKTFADCIPKSSWSEVIRAYERQKSEPDFDLAKFVSNNFELPVRPKVAHTIDTTLVIEKHLSQLWEVLKREPDKHDPKSSLIPLPNPYIVPGGRFAEIYYWDSYFTMLGLLAQQQVSTVRSMIDNFAFLIDSVGFIPNGNRAYYLSRSQPPFFSLMVKLLESGDSLAASKYLPSLQKEYDFWMDGLSDVNQTTSAVKHVVQLKEGVVLNRYFDQRSEPRPEAYKEDFNLAQNVNNAHQLYTDLRSAAESGWDFSSRWFKDGQTLKTIQTTSYIPVDLNCLLWHLEMMLSKGYRQNLKNELADEYRSKAENRRNAILEYCHNPEKNYFFDYNYQEKKQSPSLTLAGMYPLFLGIVDQRVAAKIAGVIETNFLKPGGLVTTLVNTGEQWDAPNGWAPLQWVTYKGLRNYQLNKLAADVRWRWLRQNEKVFENTGKMMEKYNVMDTTLLAGGGEYPNQDGFGWTNGVYLAMLVDTLKVK
jgi:alpha,alpha-trehalase